MENLEISGIISEGGRSQAVSISSTSAQSTALTDNDSAIVTVTTPCFVRGGTNPTALSDGTDLYLLADVAYRLRFQKGWKLAFKTSGTTGTAYISPGA